MEIALFKHFKSRITVEDADGAPAMLQILVQRMTPDEFGAWAAEFDRFTSPRSNRLLGGRKTDGDEQERTESGLFLVTDAQVRERRLAELTDEQRARYEAAMLDDEQWAREFIAGTISKYVSVPDGVLRYEGVPVTTGADLYRVYGACPPVLRALLVAVRNENTMGAVEKKAWRSLSDLSRFLDALPKAADGPRQAAVVDAAKTAASVAREAVTALTGASSGSDAGTSRSDSESVPSA